MPDRPVIQTPEFLAERAKEIHTSILQFNDDLAQQKIAGKIGDDAPKLKAWRAFRDRWAQWYGEANWWTWAWGATNATLDAYAQQMADWVRWYTRAFGAPTTAGAPTQYESPARSVGGVLPYALGAAAVTAILIAVFKR